MKAHYEASEQSRMFCEKLFEKLSLKIPNLKRSESQNWCGLNQINGPRFAYINHKKRLPRIEVWCTGDPEKLKKFDKLEVRLRDDIRGSWEERFPGRFIIENENQLDDAVILLITISLE